MSETVISLDEIAEFGLECPYLDGARAFAETQGKTTVSVDSEILVLAELNKPEFMAHAVDKFMMSKVECARIMIRNLLWLDIPEMKELLIPYLIKNKMYKEFQDHVFLKMDHNQSVEFWEKHKPSTDFMAAYPFINANGKDFLQLMIVLDNEKQALDLITRGVSVTTICSNKNSTLMLACSHGMKQVALEILKSESKGLPGYISSHGNTALIWACYTNMPEVALKILETGNASHDSIGSDNDTALLWACNNNMSEVALEILKCGNAHPGQVANRGETALGFAFRNKMRDVAAEIFKAMGRTMPEKYFDDSFDDS